MIQKASAKYYFDAKAADRAVEWIETYVRHVEGEKAGELLKLEPWERDDIVRPLIGWKKCSDGTRKYQICFIFIPRKNGKSLLAAAIALYLLFADGEPGAQIYGAARSRAQAGLVFDVAAEVVRVSPAMKRRSMTYRKSIVVEDTFSAYQTISAEAQNLDGLNAHGIIFDELHAQKDSKLLDVLLSSTSARRQPITLLITTAGLDKNSVCKEYYDHAKKVKKRPGLDDGFLPVIYEADKKDDWRKPSTWRKANPGLGSAKKLSWMRSECKRAQKIGSAELRFKRLDLNLWIDSVDTWIKDDLWMKGKARFLESSLAGEDCWGGLDLAANQDFNALVLAFPKGNQYRLLCRFWMPQEVIDERLEKGLTKYRQWVKRGYLTPTRGNTTDYDKIRLDIRELGEIYRIKDLAVDRLFQGAQLCNQLQDDDFKVISFGQGFYSMAEPTKEFESLVLKGNVRHAGNPVLRWMVENTAIETDAAGNMKPSKKKSKTRIDGVVASIMAIARAMAPDEDEPESIYNKRGLQSVSSY